MRRLLPAALFALATAGASACAGDRATPPVADVGGTLVIATAADADLLFPMLNGTATGRAVTDNVFQRLAEIGDGLNTIGDDGFTPSLARGWKWGADSMSLAFAINPKAKWHDGVPVRAEDVRFTFKLVVDPAFASATAPLLANIDSVSVKDSLTAVAWFKKRTPERFYDLAYQLYILPKHLLDTIPVPQLRASTFARKPVGSGRFRFVKWDAGARIEIAADTANPLGRPGLDRVIWTIVPEPAAALARLTSGEADLVENLRIEQLPDVGAVKTLRVAPYPSLQVVYLLFNERARNGAAAHPIFSDARARRALASALDRTSMARNVFDSLGMLPSGPLARSIAAADTSLRQWPFSPTRADAQFDSAGWRRGPDSTRSRNGRPFAFSLLVPAQSRARVRLAVLIQEALRGQGVTVTIDQPDIPAFMERSAKRDFDAAIIGFSSDPSPFGVRQSWSAGAARARDGGNLGSYANPAFDALIDSAQAAASPGAATALFHKAWQTINDDAPAIWLVEPRLAMGIHQRFRTAPLRADGWWLHLADWKIPPAERLARDAAAPAP
jgi:peptide/nickel transport system substrate-binding protein